MSALDQLTRPIIGIEYRTAQEAFDIMSDRFRAYLAASPKEQAEVVAWTVRDNPKESDELGKCYDVLLPSGEWRSCVAVDPNDARECIKAEWDEEQSKLKAYQPPDGFASPAPAGGWQTMAQKRCLACHGTGEFRCGPCPSCAFRPAPSKAEGS